MEDLMNNFKHDLEKMMGEWYEELEQLVDGALFNLSFYEGEIEEQYNTLEALMFEVLQERFGILLDERKETLSH